ncbi:MAG: nuclear transport factor 2 family protein [Dehalococcoidia bacterium]|nr:nuclear transport factor 2 family protein [Dehalococcoidia bacterium]
MTTLQQRIERLEDIEAIKDLKRRYIFSIDMGRYDDAIDTFTEDAIIDYGVFGLYKGREALRRYLVSDVTRQRSRPSIHHLHSPLIEFTNDTLARGIWELQAMAQPTTVDKAYWMAGYFTDEYVKENGQWKQNKLEITWQIITEYEKGWGKQRMAFTKSDFGKIQL